MFGSVLSPVSRKLRERPQRARASSVLALGALVAALLLGGCAGTAQRPPANFAPPSAAGANALPAGANALPAPDPADRAAIRAVLRRQERAWNDGDLKGYMAGYARTDTLRFASGGRVRTGWEETLAAYRRGYPDRRAMGTLSFTGLDVDLLSGRHALVFGRWRLARAGIEATPHGLFTLLFEKKRAGDPWRIVYDHTSAAE